MAEMPYFVRQSPIWRPGARLNGEKVSGQQVTTAQNACMCALEPDKKPDSGI